MFEITLDGRGKNALGSSMMSFLIGQLREAAGRPVLLTGAGDSFSAGLDLKEVAGLDRAGMRKFLVLLEECMTRLFLYPGPTVALVNGHAIAGGAVLALCCDWRVAPPSERARIGLNEVALGLRFPPRTLSIVRSRVPPRHLEEVLLGAWLYDPTRARELGLIDDVSADAGTVARARLAALGAHPSGAYAQTKLDLRGTAQTLASDADLDLWLDRSIPTWTSPELKKRLAAVLAR